MKALEKIATAAAVALPLALITVGLWGFIKTPRRKK